MSLHRVDPRFVLPHPVTAALVLGPLDEWRAGLRSAGVQVDAVGASASAPELVVAPAGLANAAVGIGAPAVLLEGDARRQLERAGYHVQRILLRPSRVKPSLALSLDHRYATAYAVERWSVLERRWKVFRMRAARALLSRDLFPLRLASVVTVGTRSVAQPFFVEAARRFQIGAVGGWALTLGQGDALSRNVFHLFAPRSSSPSWVVKFARVAGYSDPFDRDERGLRIADDAGAAEAGRAPRLVGRFEVEGIHASVETAAVGRRLYDILRTRASRAEKLRIVDAVAEWILQLAERTRTSASELAPEHRRLRDEVLPRSAHLGVGPVLADRVSALPAVAQHNDLGSWNIVVAERGFTAVDWESARRFGMPLWDLLYFLADALVLLDGAPPPSERPARTAILFAGDAPSSDFLFAWVRRAVRALELPPEAVGPLATLCWLHHSLSGPSRDEVLTMHTPSERAAFHGLEAMAEAWLAHSELGVGWSRWRGA
jgi:hypothetical protein